MKGRGRGQESEGVNFLLFFFQGRQGDTVLVAGVSTGTAKVQVRLVDKTWKVENTCT